MKETSKVQRESLTIEHPNELLDHSKYPNGIPYYNLYPYKAKAPGMQKHQAPIASRAFELSFSVQVPSSNTNIFLSSIGENGLSVNSESNEPNLIKPKQNNFKDVSNAISEAKYFHLIKVMRLARYSILTVCFSDILTLFFPLFIFPIVYAIKGLKMLNFCFLFLYVLYLVLSAAPYLALSYFVKRVEVYVICAIFVVIKIASFVIVVVLMAKGWKVKGEMRTRLIVDFNSNPGKNCFCC